MAKVVTMGEIMLRLSTNGYKRFTQSNNFDVVYGGGEANVSVSLANYGHDSYFVTIVGVKGRSTKLHTVNSITNLSAIFTP